MSKKPFMARYDWILQKIHEELRRDCQTSARTYQEGREVYIDHEEVEAGLEEPITPLCFQEATRRNPVRRDRSRQPRFLTSQEAINTVKVRRPEEWNILDHVEVEAGREEQITSLSFQGSTGVNPVRRGRLQRPGLQRIQKDQEDQKGLDICKRVQEPTLHGSTGNIVIQDSRI